MKKFRLSFRRKKEKRDYVNDTTEDNEESEEDVSLRFFSQFRGTVYFPRVSNHGYRVDPLKILKIIFEDFQAR